jgi:hypothetical protein
MICDFDTDQGRTGCVAQAKWWLRETSKSIWHPRCGRHALLPGNSPRQRTPISGPSEIPPPRDFDPKQSSP